jgi:hypothetical protein
MGTKRPNKRRDWDSLLKELGSKLGFQVMAWDPYPAKRSKVLIRCKHGEKWVFPQGQLNKSSCCKVSSKSGDKNPFFGKPTWNAGTKGVSTGRGFGFKPRGRKTYLPGKLYLVEYTEEGKTHFKLGITGNSTQKRLKTKLQKIIKEWELPLGKCFDLEQAALRYASQHGHRYSSSTTTELIRPEGILPILEFIESNIANGFNMA